MNNTDIYGNIGNVIGGALGTGAQLYGQQNAGEAITNADLSAINTQKSNLGNINSLYNPYLTGGSNAETQLGSALGTNGQPANYSNFMNMPGYQFALQQGTQAIQRQAAASGSAFTPNTDAAVGQYVTGTAMQDYNTYINQLQAQAGMGANAASSLGNITYGVGNNISQLQQNTGMAQAGMYTGMGQTASGLLNGTNPNSSGLAGLLGLGGGSGAGAGGAGGGVGSLIGSGLRSLFGGGSGSNSNPNQYGPSTGTDANGGYVDAYGNYITPQMAAQMGGGGNTPGDMNTGYDNSQTDLSQSQGAYSGDAGSSPYIYSGD